MKINATPSLSKPGEQTGKTLPRESKETKQLLASNTAKLFMKEESADNLSHVRSRLKVYMEEIKTLQQELSRLQEQEMALKKDQEKLQRIQEKLVGNDGLDGDETGKSLEERLKNTSEGLARLEKSQKEIQTLITEKMVAHNNIMASMTVIREKDYAEKIMEKIRDSINAETRMSVQAQSRLHRENIYVLLG